MADADVPDDYYSNSEFEFEPEGGAEQSTNDDSGGNDSGSLSPASAARIEVLTRKLNAIKKVIEYCVGEMEADASQILVGPLAMASYALWGYHTNSRNW